MCCRFVSWINFFNACFGFVIIIENRNTNKSWHSAPITQFGCAISVKPKTIYENRTKKESETKTKISIFVIHAHYTFIVYIELVERVYLWNFIYLGNWFMKYGPMLTFLLHYRLLLSLSKSCHQRMWKRMKWKQNPKENNIIIQIWNMDLDSWICAVTKINSISLKYWHIQYMKTMCDNNEYQALNTKTHKIVQCSNIIIRKEMYECMWE